MVIKYSGSYSTYFFLNIISTTYTWNWTCVWHGVSCWIDNNNIVSCRFRVVKLCKKIDVMMREFNFFGVTNFTFDNKNVKSLILSQSNRDKKLFNMDLSDINWADYHLECIYGIRRYMLNEHDNSSAGQKRYQK